MQQTFSAQPRQAGKVVESEERQRAYSLGYNAGRRWAHAAVERVVRVARGYRARALLPAEAARTCAGCARWRREGSCHWGTCLAEQDRQSFEPWMRAWGDGTPDTVPVRTYEDFGCVNFLPLQDVNLTLTSTGAS